MKKQNFRSLGIGFLCASIVTALFAIFGQGHVPIQGVSVSSLFNTTEQNDAELSQYRDEVSQLQSENASYSSEIASLNNEVSTLRQQVNEQSSQESSSASTNTNEASEIVVQTFTINEGDTSSEIADQLVSAGIITDASELLDLISYWGLDSMIVAGTYDLNSDMTVDQVAEIITQGAYYYIP